MKYYIETERLILRELLPTDVDAFFELESSPEVHKYLGNKPISTIEQAHVGITNIRQQYIDNGIGRWAVVEKASGNFIGWSGLKYIKTTENNHTNFYDVGYRFIPRYWSKGYATESAKAAIDYGFTKMALSEIIGFAMVTNIKSRRALEKCGLKFIESYENPVWNNAQCDWLKISKQDWLLR